MNIAPYAYQIRGARRLHQLGGRALLADEMGLGKGVQTIMYLERHPEQRPAVVVCPASLKWNWARECAAHAGLRAEILEGTRPPRRVAPNACPVLIVNYDILGKRRGRKTGDGWLGYLKALRPRVVVLDECHYVANPRSRRCRWVRDLCRGVPHVLALSGTPLTNRPAELFPILNLLRPDLYPDFFPFAREFCAPKRTPWGWDFRGSSNLDKLHDTLGRQLMIRRRKADVLAELPPKTRVVVPLDLSDRAEYDRAAADFLRWLAAIDERKARRAAQAERLVRLGYLKRLAASLKLPAVEAWADDFLAGSEGKLILFAIHKDVVARLAARYRDLAVTVTGDAPAAERMRAVDRFQRDARVRLFLGNIQAAGVGLNLTAAHSVAFAELDWTPGAHAQAEDRAYGRLSDLHGATIYYLAARGTVEERLLEVIQAKQRTLAAALDGGSSPNDLDVYDLLTESLQEGRP